MKSLKIFILAIFLLSAFPLEAFCSDAHQETNAGHGHCVLMCHSVCFHATAPDQKVFFIPATPVVSLVFSAIDVSYQNPSLDTLKRPPVVSA
jgi:hypothetical protein